MDRPGWLRLSPKSSVKANTLIKNDGEHNYSLITRVDFTARSTRDEAGLWIMRGDEVMYVKLVSSFSSDGKKVIRFSFGSTQYELQNSVGDTLWLKLVRINHEISGYFSSNGANWTEVGQAVDISQIDSYSDYSTFTGTRQGLYLKGTSDAWFDLYIYRDAYTPILAECPANQYGTSRAYNSSAQGYVLDNIHMNDWAMYAGVEFGGNTEYNKISDLLKIIASCNTSGSSVQVWLDSLDAGDKIAECPISNTGSLRTFQTFAAAVKPVKGRHDVYLKFTGSETGKLFQLQWLCFTAQADTSTSVPEPLDSAVPQKYGLEQNFPNPFNPTTWIEFVVPNKSVVSLKVYNLLGEEMKELAGRELPAGKHTVSFDGSQIASGIYFYNMSAEDFVKSRKMILMK